MRKKSDKRMEALGCILNDGLHYSWFDVLELDSDAVTAKIRVEVDTDKWVTKDVSADDVARGLRMYREWLEGKREGYPGEWGWRMKDAIRAGQIKDESEFDPAVHARADAGSYGWQTVKFDRTNGDDGDYDANTADSVMQFALIGSNQYS
jgi:hypothetical protein